MMNFKKISILVIFLVFFIPNFVKADTLFLDNNAISNLKDKDVSILVSEVNTGKIISKHNENKKVSVSKLPSYLALFLLTDNLKNNKITLDSKISIDASDDILASYGLGTSLSVRDALFLLQNSESPALLKAIFNEYKVNLEEAKTILSSIGLHDTELNFLEYNANNMSSARNISYLITVILQNYPGLTDITKSNFTFSSGITANNQYTFSNDNFSMLPINYDGQNSTFYSYKDNTKLLITVLNQGESREVFLDKIGKIYEYLFENYSYEVVIKTGVYNFNNESISTTKDVYDLIYKKYSTRDITYVLINNRILLLQKYETLSANNGVVTVDYTISKTRGILSEVKSRFINGTNFENSSNLEKLEIIIQRTRYFVTGILAFYSLVFMATYIMKQSIRKD